MKIERAKVLSGIFTGVLTGGLTFSVFALSGCGKSGGNSDLNACGGTTANTRAGAFSEKIFFVASNQQDSTIVCSFDLKIKGLREEFIPPADSNDVTLFLDEGSAHLFVNERWSGKQSRPSRITSLDSAGGVQTEIAKLPGNLHDLLKLRDGTFVAAGFDKGEFAHVTLQGNFIRATKTLAGLRGTIDDADSRLDTFLNAANRTFVVSQGFELSTFKPTLAKIHRLSSDLSGIEKTFPVQSSDGLKTCENAYAVQPVARPSGVRRGDGGRTVAGRLPSAKSFRGFLRPLKTGKPALTGSSATPTVPPLPSEKSSRERAPSDERAGHVHCHGETHAETDGDADARPTPSAQQPTPRHRHAGNVDGIAVALRHHDWLRRPGYSQSEPRDRGVGQHRSRHTTHRRLRRRLGTQPAADRTGGARHRPRRHRQ